jgi:hypothetical protein
MSALGQKRTFGNELGSPRDIAVEVRRYIGARRTNKNTLVSYSEKIILASAINQCFRKDSDQPLGQGGTYRWSYETNLLPGPSRNELWQRLFWIVVAVRTWCSKPARIKPFRANQFH